MSASSLLGLRNASLLRPRALLALSGAPFALTLFFLGLRNASLLRPRALLALSGAPSALTLFFFGLRNALLLRPRALLALTLFFLLGAGRHIGAHAPRVCFESRIARLAAE